MRVYIDGTDITNLIAYQGLKIGRHDVDGPNAGRNLAGTMIRDRVATKMRLDITCRPMTTEELEVLSNLILPEYVTVQYDEPAIGTVSIVAYSNNNTYEYCFLQNNGTELWHNVSFPLVEK